MARRHRAPPLKNGSGPIPGPGDGAAKELSEQQLSTHSTPNGRLLGLAWSAPQCVATRYGPRLLSKAPPSAEFWAAWQIRKPELSSAGIAISRSRGGDWEVCHWQPIAAREPKRRKVMPPPTVAAIDVPAPAGLRYLPFQCVGIAFAASRPASLIADEMGLGKTIEALGVINARKAKTALVICPASLRLNWANELRKWLVKPRKIGIANGPYFPPTDCEAVVCNFDILAKHRHRIRARRWGALIVDEAHYLKNPKAKRTREVLGYRSIEPIAADVRLFLTGTPIVNRPVELWPILHSLDSEGLGRSWQAYVLRYCGAYRNRWGWDTSGATNLAELQASLRESVMIRRRKGDVLADLPPKRRQVVTLPAEGAEEIVRAECAAYDEHRGQIAQAERAVELSQASDDPADYERAVAHLRGLQGVLFQQIARFRRATALAKLPYLLAHVADAIEAGKVVVFCHHKDVVAAVAEKFGTRCVTLTGDTALADRQAAVERFQSDPECALFVGTIGAGGVGITLTASSHVIFAELDWVPATLTQAEDRLHRIGQRGSVLVQHLVLDNSLDARLAETIIGKQGVLDAALDKPVRAA